VAFRAVADAFETQVPSQEHNCLTAGLLLNRHFAIVFLVKGHGLRAQKGFNASRPYYFKRRMTNLSLSTRGCKYGDEATILYTTSGLPTQRLRLEERQMRLQKTHSTMIALF